MASSATLVTSRVYSGPSLCSSFRVYRNNAICPTCISLTMASKAVMLNVSYNEQIRSSKFKSVLKNIKNNFFNELKRDL